MNGPEMNDDDIDGTLEQAGDRLAGRRPPQPTPVTPTTHDGR